MRRSARFVGKAEAGRGWRVWDKRQKKWWGPVFATQPDDVLEELNGPKRPDRLSELMREQQRNGRVREVRGS